MGFQGARVVATKITRSSTHARRGKGSQNRECKSLEWRQICRWCKCIRHLSGIRPSEQIQKVPHSLVEPSGQAGRENPEGLASSDTTEGGSPLHPGKCQALRGVSNAHPDSGQVHYRGTSLIGSCNLLGPYSRVVPRALWWP